MVGSRLFRAGAGALRARHAERGTLLDRDGAPLDDALALWFPGPASATGEDVLELHVHGSPAIVAETLAAAVAAGARLAGPGEFTRRAFEAGKLDLSAAEAVAELIAAEGRGAARAALGRLGGGLATEVDRLAADLSAVLEELSAALDFPDEVPAPDATMLAARLAGVDAELSGLARDGAAGRLVREGIGVAIVGAPNAGKSTLLNALLGTDRALVSAVAGTTRDTIEERVALGDGFEARLVDTAGLRASADALEAAGIARTRRELAAATIALVVVDVARPLDSEAAGLVAETGERPRVVFGNKADVGSDGVAALIRAAASTTASECAAVVVGSAHSRETVEAVRAALRSVASGLAGDVARPHLGTARQIDAVAAARRAIAAARATLAAGEPIDLVAGDLLLARAELGALTGRDASEAVLDGVFARFCIGK